MIRNALLLSHDVGLSIFSLLYFLFCAWISDATITWVHGQWPCLTGLFKYEVLHIIQQKSTKALRTSRLSYNRPLNYLIRKSPGHPQMTLLWCPALLFPEDLHFTFPLQPGWPSVWSPAYLPFICLQSAPAGVTVVIWWDRNRKNNWKLLSWDIL